MAELKYDLALVNTKTDKKIRPKPWYKERIQTHYIKSLKPTDTSKMLIADNWSFIKTGLDDFRDGLPPPIGDDGIFVKGTKGLKPNITGSSESLRMREQKANLNRKRFTKEEVCFSRTTPLQQQRRDHINEIEYGLTQHPLALYPHLEECMPPDIFEDVVDILDPEMNIDSDAEDSSEGSPESRRSVFSPSETKQQEEPQEEEEEQPEDEEPKVRNPYRWLPKKEEKDKKDKKKMEKRASSPSQDEHIKQVTKEFCDWVAGLGGESNNIEESTITSLFASGYETKPALSVPIHVVELTNVPPELRMSAAIPQAQVSKEAEQSEKSKVDLSNQDKYTPSWVKFKYGAWYLSPKSWKKRDAEEPLRDPKEIKDGETSEAKKKSNSMDAELAPMHGAKAFMEFMEKKNTRRPEFLKRVKEYQEKQAAEEQAKLEAEMAKQAKSRPKLAEENKKEDEKK